MFSCVVFHFLSVIHWALCLAMRLSRIYSMKHRTISISFLRQVAEFPDGSISDNIVLL